MNRKVLLIKTITLIVIPVFVTIAYFFFVFSSSHFDEISINNPVFQLKNGGTLEISAYQFRNEETGLQEFEAITENDFIVIGDYCRFKVTIDDQNGTLTYAEEFNDEYIATYEHNQAESVVFEFNPISYDVCDQEEIEIFVREVWATPYLYIGGGILIFVVIVAALINIIVDQHTANLVDNNEFQEIKPNQYELGFSIYACVIFPPVAVIGYLYWSSQTDDVARFQIAKTVGPVSFLVVMLYYIYYIWIIIS